jgi:hypothetical protein
MLAVIPGTGYVTSKLQLEEVASTGDLSSEVT